MVRTEFEGLNIPGDTSSDTGRLQRTSARSTESPSPLWDPILPPVIAGSSPAK